MVRNVVCLLACIHLQLRNRILLVGSKRCTNNVQIIRCSREFWVYFLQLETLTAKETIVFPYVFYGSLYCPGYEQIFHLNEQGCWHRSGLTSHSEIEPLLFVFDPGKTRTIKQGVYTEADTNQEVHLHLEMKNTGKQIQQVPTWAQAERNKTDISVRNTLSQLHWLHHFVNTQYRQALIANIWRVWIYKNQTKVPPAPAHLYLSLCTLYDAALSQISFSQNTLWPQDAGWWVKVTRPLLPY